MATISRAVTINATLITVLLVLGLALGRRPDRFMKEIRRIEAQTEQRIAATKPANVVSSCASLVAVLFAWRTFTGYRRRVEG
ncbi:MAG: hypothetical protein K2X03_13810 [Bryobacteraceae bacterium]|nr:hypothetical protein [Bryobacteraceae bacterium]